MKQITIASATPRRVVPSKITETDFPTISALILDISSDIIKEVVKAPTVRQPKKKIDFSDMYV